MFLERSDRIVGYLSPLRFKAQLVKQQWTTKPDEVEGTDFIEMTANLTYVPKTFS